MALFLRFSRTWWMKPFLLKSTGLMWDKRNRGRSMIPTRVKPLPHSHHHYPYSTECWHVQSCTPETSQGQQDQQTLQYQWWVQFPQADTQCRPMWSIDQSWELQSEKWCILTVSSLTFLSLLREWIKSVPWSFGALISVHYSKLGR
jgi:hypothetical protein